MAMRPPYRGALTFVLLAFGAFSLPISAPACSAFGAAKNDADPAEEDAGADAAGGSPNNNEGGAGDTGAGVDAPSVGVDAGPCGSGCPSGTACVGVFGCHVTTEPTCDNTAIEVPLSGAVFDGTICAYSGTDVTVCENQPTKGHIFRLSGPGDHEVTLGIRSKTLRLNTVDPQCKVKAGVACEAHVGPSTSLVKKSVSSPTHVAVALDLNEVDCAEYVIAFAPKPPK